MKIQKILIHGMTIVPILMVAVMGNALASVCVQTVRPSTNSTFAIVEDAFLQSTPRNTFSADHLPLWVLSAQYGYVHTPLIEYVIENNSTVAGKSNVLVRSINSLDLNASVYPVPGVETSLSIPLELSHLNGQDNRLGLGDVRLQGKVRIGLGRNDMALAVIPELTIPVGSRDLLLSNDSWGLGMGFSYEVDIQLLRISGNVGYRYSANALFNDIDYRNLISLGLGVHAELSPYWGANVEITRSVAIPSNFYNNPSEFYLGARYQAERTLSYSGGFSIPTLFEAGSGDFRFLVNVKYTLLP